jgi:hypothetical protein
LNNLFKVFTVLVDQEFRVSLEQREKCLMKMLDRVVESLRRRAYVSI